MLLHDARRDARVDDGDLVLLADQDRSRWDPDQIAEGRAAARPGPRARRAAAPTSSRRRSRRCTPTSRPDWRQIAVLYGELARLTGSPVVELNRAVAVAEADGPAAGLALVDRLRPSTATATCTPPGPTCCAASGRTDEARDAYLRALALVHDEPERRLLERRLSELGR